MLCNSILTFHTGGVLEFIGTTSTYVGLENLKFTHIKIYSEYFISDNQVIK